MVEDYVNRNPNFKKKESNNKKLIKSKRSWIAGILMGLGLYGHSDDIIDYSKEKVEDANISFQIIKAKNYIEDMKADLSDERLFKKYIEEYNELFKEIEKDVNLKQIKEIKNRFSRIKASITIEISNEEKVEIKNLYIAYLNKINELENKIEEYNNLKLIQNTN